MTNNTPIDITKQLVKGLVVSKYFELRPYKGSDEVKKFKLELTIDDVTVYDMALGLLASEVIKVQNVERPKWSKLVNNKIYKKKFNKPMVADPTDAYHAEFDAMSPEDQQKEIEKLLAKVKQTPNEVA